MKIKNIDGLSAEYLQKEVEKGGRFIYYSYTVSVIILTFKGTSGVYLVRAGKKMNARRIGYTLLSMLTGWWGIPKGPEHTIKSIRTNLKGGKDVTDEVMSVVTGYALYKETKTKNQRA